MLCDTNNKMMDHHDHDDFDGLSAEEVQLGVAMAAAALKLELKDVSTSTSSSSSSESCVDLYALAFSELTNNYQVDGTLHGIGPEKDGIFMLGTDQRDYFLPYIDQSLRSKEIQKPIKHVFDLGCGDGKTTHFLFPQFSEGCTIYGLDVSLDYLSSYEEDARQNGSNFEFQSLLGPIGAFYDDNKQGGQQLPRSSCEISLGLHSIYFSDDNDMAYVRMLMNSLKPNGTAFIVFADETFGYGGKMFNRYLRLYATEKHTNYEQKIKNRMELFGIVDEPTQSLLLEWDSTTQLRGQAVYQKTRFYARDWVSLMKQTFVSELCCSDVTDLDTKIDFVAHELMKNYQDYGLVRIHDPQSPRHGMLSVLQPQYIVRLGKISKIG